MATKNEILSVKTRTALVAAVALASGVLQGEVKTDVNLVPAIRAAGTYPTFWSTIDKGSKTNTGYLFDEIVWQSGESPDNRWVTGSYGESGIRCMTRGGLLS